MCIQALSFIIDYEKYSEFDFVDWNLGNCIYISDKIYCTVTTLEKNENTGSFNVSAP